MRARDFWTADEDRLLLALEEKGLLFEKHRAVVEEMLPGRTLGSAQSRLYTLQARRRAYQPGGGGVPVPDKPQGMTDEQVQWALANAATREAAMILGFKAGRV